MPKILCLSFAILGLLMAPAFAKNIVDPATHVWVDISQSTSVVPVRTVIQCEMYIRQAAKLERYARGHCYNNAEFKGQIKCERKTKKKVETIECEWSQ